MSELVRNTDPIESHLAAGAINGTLDQDRLIVLSAFKDLGKGTYREAAVHALRDDTNVEVARLESLRRRGSDLKALGWITQVGRYQGQAEFKVTEEGWAISA